MRRGDSGNISRPPAARAECIAGPWYRELVAAGTSAGQECADRFVPVGFAARWTAVPRMGPAPA